MPKPDLDLGGPPAISPRRADVSGSGRQQASSAVVADSPTRSTSTQTSPGTIDEALGSKAKKPIATRLQSDLWDLVGARAVELGVPIRLILVDALVRALEDRDGHIDRLRETDHRERIAAANRPQI